MKLFDHISEIAEDTTALVCVLIDEIESIASARNASIRSNEPSDAVRYLISFLSLFFSYQSSELLTQSSLRWMHLSVVPMF
jgi:hypothetical protein